MKARHPASHHPRRLPARSLAAEESTIAADGLGLTGPDGGNETVTSLGQGLNKARVLGGVVQCFAQLVYGDPEAMVEIDGCFRSPQLKLQSLTGYHFAGVFQQRREHLKWLALQADTSSGAAQLLLLQDRLQRCRIALSRCHSFLLPFSFLFQQSWPTRQSKSKAPKGYKRQEGRGIASKRRGETMRQILKRKCLIG